MQFNRLFESLKSRLRVTILCTIFLFTTTFVSVNLIYFMARISTNSPIPDTDLGIMILGSIFGQVTLLIAIPLVDKIGKAKKRLAEDITDELDEYIRDGRDPNDT
ncbi:hypothetical protein ES703_48216 [subsurface metagenome]